MFLGCRGYIYEKKGVKATSVGYTGGNFSNPTYEDVCTDKTGHAEAIQLRFDPREVSYEELLDLFWSIHDPTTKNRQGPDIGSQYRSTIFYHTAEQENIAKNPSKTLMIQNFRTKLLQKLYRQQHFIRQKIIIKNIIKRMAEAVAIFEKNVICTGVVNEEKS